MNTHCTLLDTVVTDASLAKLMLDKDATFAPMGSGGYSIRKAQKSPKDVTHLEFRALDSASPTYSVFLKDGQIWVTHVRGFVMELLCEHNITFTCAQVKNPSFIGDHLKVVDA